MDAAEWDERYAGAELLWSAEPNRFVVGEVANFEPGRALDIACGEGRNAVWLAELGWAATAVDFSPVALARARAVADARDVEVDWILTDVVSYRPGAASFDLVIIAYLHLPGSQITKVIRSAAGAVAPGGTLLLIGHDRENLARGVGGPQDPDLLWTSDEITDLIDGFDIERAGQVTREVDVDGEQREAIDTLVRARRPA